MRGSSDDETVAIAKSESVSVGMTSGKMKRNMAIIEISSLVIEFAEDESAEELYSTRKNSLRACLQAESD